MAAVSFTVTRNVDATDQLGRPCKVALASIAHENGVIQTVAVPEALIAYAGDGIIAEEVARATASPSDEHFGKKIKLPRH